MEKNEKRKEIKKALKCCSDRLCEICSRLKSEPNQEEDCRCALIEQSLSYINELESENEKLKQSNKNILFVNDKVVERNQELEEALLDMVVQFCQMGKEGDLCHTFMSAEENAFDVLDIEYGEKVDDVYKRFNKKWGKEDGE